MHFIAEGLNDSHQVKWPTKLLNKPQAHPFVKWAGGKRSLIPILSVLLPNKFKDYYEPFVGGGSVFFSLAHCIHKAYLSDLNQVLMYTYQIVQQKPHHLINALKKHQSNHSKKYYEQIRDQYGFQSKSIDLAATFIYLNKTCFNGLYRVNRSGKFNVPIGSYNNPMICNEANLLNASRVLKKATLKSQSFEAIHPQAQDLIYCDPPYDETFTSYTQNGFNSASQEKLKNYCDEWRKLGAYVVISNNDTPLIRELYRGYRFIRVEMTRNINRDGSKRNKVPELLILGY